MLKSICIFAIWAFTRLEICEAQVVACGKPPMESRIVGGQNAPVGAWPWQVDIQKTTHVCGGSVLSQTWVLSAAHCFPNPSDTSSYILYVGRSVLNGLNQYESTHGVKQIILPSGFQSPQQGLDVALIELSSQIVFTDYIQPICLPDISVQFPDGFPCYVTGWGDIRDGVSLPGAGQLQEVQVPIIDQTACQNMYQLQPDLEVTILSDMICAGYQQGGKDACQGDSGGPLVCEMTNQTWVQAGVVSYGEGCAQANSPGVYAKLSTFTSFIRSNVPDAQFYGRAGQNRPAAATPLACSLLALLAAWLLGK